MRKPLKSLVKTNCRCPDVEDLAVCKIEDAVLMSSKFVSNNDDPVLARIQQIVWSVNTTDNLVECSVVEGSVVVTRLL